MSNNNNKSTKNNSGKSGQNSASRTTKAKQIKRSNNNNNSNQRAIVRSPVPISMGMVVRQQNFKKKDSFIVSHTEYVADIQANAEAFHLAKTFILNPGDPDSFPWCSQFGNLYESYVFRKLRYRWEPACSTTTQGFVAFVPDFNPLESAPLNKQQAFQNEKTVRGSPFKNFAVTFSQEQLNKRKSYFARSNSEVVADANKEVYDTGNLRIYVGGCVDNSTSLGEVWVDYDVEFRTPEAPTQVPGVLSLSNSNTAVPKNVTNPLGVGLADTTILKSQEDLFSYYDTGGFSTLGFNKPFQGIVQTFMTGASLNNFALDTVANAKAALTALNPLNAPNTVYEPSPTGAATKIMQNLFVNAQPGGAISWRFGGAGPDVRTVVQNIISAANPSLILPNIL